ncbi:hypothetical protein [Candidatus Enterovibrio escicola]|uniref:hypothetical protein n=1 Tax=Candidatus Enterovibrio escicola TaxID=1927127 RepID=UPI001CC23DD7|nr:hypothetical protein [Candidatus Enterovibrio escacola]
MINLLAGLIACSFQPKKPSIKIIWLDKQALTADLRLSYSCQNPCAGDSFFQTIRSQLRHLVHFLCAAQVSLLSVGDNEVLPTLLNPLRRKIQQVSTV